MNLMDTMQGSLLENFFPSGWDLAKMGSKIIAIPTEPAKAAGKGKTAPVTER